jgi:hypothetical protein
VAQPALAGKNAPTEGLRVRMCLRSARAVDMLDIEDAAAALRQGHAGAYHAVAPAEAAAIRCATARPRARAPTGAWGAVAAA